MSDRSPLEGKSSDLEHISCKCQASFPLWSNSLDNHNSSEASSSRIGVPPYNHQRHSTLSDPNFVENYFKAGMFVKEANTRSPKLVFVPYNFGAYEMLMVLKYSPPMMDFRL
ncbi:hypothetical protein ACS0TY_000191 [Phlomoides rotata]